MAWTTACPDWAERLRTRQSIIPPPIYPDQAEYALGIFKQLKVVDLAQVYDEAIGTYRHQTFGECSEEWVFDFVRAIFGGYDAATGKQRIREYGLLISKKNTKSTIAAGIMLTAIIICWRQEEEHLILAPTKEVADNSFKPAAAMIRADEELSDMFHVQDHIRTITHRTTRNSLKVVAADTDSVSGKKSGRILVDELWLFGKRANAVAMFLEALGGQISRDEGWVIYLTTQSDDPPAGVFKEKLAYWRDVRDGRVVDPKTLGILYEFPEEMVEAKAYLDPANFYITNPNLGRSVSAEWLGDQLKLLQARTDGAFQQFLAKHLNVEIGLNLRSDRWAGADHWLKQGKRVLTLRALMDRSEVVTAGIDGGGLDDLLGLAFLGRERGSGNWLHWARAWAHPSVLERRKEIEPRLRDFERAGELVIVKQIGDDTAELAALIRQVYDAGLFPEKCGIGADQNGVTFNDALVEAEIPEELIVGVSQGWKLGGIIKTVERKLAEGTFVHGDQALMAWAVGNARIELRANGILITKQASGTAKIDPLMATFDAAQLMVLNPEASGRSVYESRGIRFI
ncbi:MAG: phage terminase family protein [Achromobacter mucicolens]|jgi:phage terminase large subunit-like protein|uniref:terminase large subunit n=1 Tax=Achromobacter mucicolens TaxID=1389922 RepID=UPI0024306115|nr:terminase large subunit [Achromobacter mucicolens]MDF2863651.1 phage terminase family protein [Achromobacter mucicolens]